MGSLLTNTASMVALSTLRNINSNLADVQNQISTGLRVSNARDNAAVYAISSVMNSDVRGFEAIGSSLALGSSTVAVARGASEQVNELLQEIKGSIVAAQEDNVDRTKIQEDISRLRDQIVSIVDAAQFNGLNLVKGDTEVDILASLDRDSQQNVTSSSIAITRFDLTTNSGTFVDDSADANPTTSAITKATLTDNGTDGQLTAAATTYDIDFTDGGDSGTVAASSAFTIVVGEGADQFTATYTAADGDYDNDALTPDTAETVASVLAGLVASFNNNSTDPDLTAAVNSGGDGIVITNNTNFNDYAINITSAGGSDDTIAPATGAGASLDSRAETLSLSSATVINSGDAFRVTIGTENFDYVAKNGDTASQVLTGLQSAINNGVNDGTVSNIAVEVTLPTDAEPIGTLKLASTTGDQDLALAQRDNGIIGGGLELLADIDVSTETSATSALNVIEDLIQTAIDGAAQFGSAQRRIDIQSDFILDLTDSLKAGIGSLVDADLEQASAQLQSLQVQQQLGIQALSIANQNPQTLLSLFR
ncbi:MAG: flagellin [Pseudomonadota bacterium]